MARVYLAEYESHMNFRRMVALKVVRPEYAKDDKFIQLMAREALIGSWLQHPNIVETLEFNQAEGRHYLALEFVEGNTLQGYLEEAQAAGRSSLAPIVALDAMIQVCRGLGYAHALRSPEGEALDIVHRDLKPGNIMLSNHGIVKIMDFGIAKAKVAVAMLTAAGQVRGTPIYMAPEQVLGKPLDGKADQFAAATVLHELLTGKQVFLSGNLVQIMTRVAKVDIGSAPEEADQIVPGVGAILRRMWSKAPDNRFPDCTQIATLLHDLAIRMRRSELLQEVQDLADPGKTLAAPVKALQPEAPAKKKDKGAKLGPEASPPKAEAKESRGSNLFNLVAGGLGLGRKKEPEPAPKKPLATTAPDQQRVSGPQPVPPKAAPSPPSPPKANPSKPTAEAPVSARKAAPAPEPTAIRPSEGRPTPAAEGERSPRPGEAPQGSEDTDDVPSLTSLPSVPPAPASAAEVSPPAPAATTAPPAELPPEQDPVVGTTLIMKRQAGLPKKTTSLSKVSAVGAAGKDKASDPTKVNWKGRPTAGLKNGADDDGEEVDHSDAADDFFFGESE
jgi:serine/threonine-protein kinase